MISTSIEQAERLLGAGLGRDTADMYWGCIEFPGGSRLICVLSDNQFIDKNTTIAPAWSLSKLWQLVHELDKTYDFDTKMSADELMELLVKTLCFRLEHQTSDFL